MRAVLTAALCLGPVALWAQDVAAPVAAIVDLRGASPVIEVLPDQAETDARLATLVFPGAGGVETVFFGGLSMETGQPLAMSDAQRSAVSGRIGVALMHAPGAAPVVRLSDDNAVEVDLDGDGWPETISVCLSETLVHIMAEGDDQEEPLWQRAFPLGYDVEPTCEK